MWGAILLVFFAFVAAGAAFGTLAGVVAAVLAAIGCGLLALYTDLFEA